MKETTTEQKIIRTQRIEINKLSKRLMTLEMRVSQFEDELLWQSQDQGWQQESLEELEEKIKELELKLDNIKLEKMVFPES